MRRMEQIDLLASEIERNPELLANGIGLCNLRHRSKVWAEIFQGAAISGAAEHHVLGRRVQPRQVAEQVPKIRADAVVPNLASIDRDSQDTAILLRELPLESQIGPQHRCPTGVMLLVKGQLAPSIRAVDVRRNRRAR